MKTDENLKTQEEVVESKTANQSKHIIDCDAPPHLPFPVDNWKVVEHKKGGLFEWNPAWVQLYLSSNQKNGRVIDGNELRKELANESVLNANVLDYLIANPQLIPEGWKGKHIFFWGTIYRFVDGTLFVRYLNWEHSQWDWYCLWLGRDWNDLSPAALAA